MRRNGERKGLQVFITLIKEELELIARGALATRLKRRGAKSLEHLSREVVNTNSTERRGQGRSCLARRLLVWGYGTKGPRTSRRFLFWAAVHRWISPIQPLWFCYRDIFFFIVPRDFLGNLLPCCKQSNLNSTLSLFFLSSRAGSTPAACVHLTG